MAYHRPKRGITTHGWILEKGALRLGAAVRGRPAGGVVGLEASIYGLLRLRPDANPASRLRKPELHARSLDSPEQQLSVRFNSGRWTALQLVDRRFHSVQLRRMVVQRKFPSRRAQQRQQQFSEWHLQFA